MKYYILLLIISFSLFFILHSQNSFAQDTINIAKSKPDKSHIILAGRIIRALDSDEFIIQDSTGEIEIEIDFSTDRQEYSFFQKYPNLVGSEVVIEGFLDKEFMERIKIDVTRIEVISTSNNDPFSDVVNKAKSATK